MKTLFLLAAIGPQERAVWLSFGFHLLNLLLPIIPAVIIYRLFPEGTTRGNAASGDHADGNAIEGDFGGWKIKAVGAWGAYVTAFALGFWAIKSTAIPLIRAVGGASVWKITSNVQLLDNNGKEVNAAINNLIIKPPMVETWGKTASITIFSPTLDPPDQLQVKLDGYEDETVDLTEIQPKNGKIKIPRITLRQLPPLNTASPAPTQLPPGAGPPAIASNP